MVISAAAALVDVGRRQDNWWRIVGDGRRQRIRRRAPGAVIAFGRRRQWTIGWRLPFKAAGTRRMSGGRKVTSAALNLRSGRSRNDSDRRRTRPVETPVALDDA